MAFVFDLPISKYVPYHVKKFNFKISMFFL